MHVHEKLTEMVKIFHNRGAVYEHVQLGWADNISFVAIKSKPSVALNQHKWSQLHATYLDRNISATNADL